MPTCWYGNHVSLTTETLDGVRYCAAHPPLPSGDPARNGTCTWDGGHGPVSVWRVPRDGRDYCLAHLSRILAIATWPEPYRK